MCSFSKKRSLSADEIGNHIKMHADIELFQKPYVYLPDIQTNGYEYDDNKTCLPLGLNEKDKVFLPNSAFVLVNNNSTNALSTSIKSIPIIGLFWGSINKIEHIANLMIGSEFEKGFLAEQFEPKRFYIDANGTLSIENKNCYLGYKDERVMSYLMAETALRFIILHEIGHHYLGHITDLSSRCKGFVLLKADDDTDLHLEMEADTFAAQTLAREYSLVLQGLINHKEELSDFFIEELELVALNTMITAMTIPFSILYKPSSNKELGTKGSIVYREMSALINLTSKLYLNKTCKKAAIYDLCNKTDEELEEANRILRKKINIKKIKATQTIDYTDFYNYILIMFIESKQLYYSVNKINNLEDYLETYIKTLSALSSEKQ